MRHGDIIIKSTATVCAKHSSNKGKNRDTKKDSLHGKCLNTVKKNLEELVHILVQNKITHVLSIFTRFDTNLSQKCLRI